MTCPDCARLEKAYAGATKRAQRLAGENQRVSRANAYALDRIAQQDAEIERLLARIERLEREKQERRYR